MGNREGEGGEGLGGRGVRGERAGGEGLRRERGVGEREKEDKRLKQSREILSMDTGPFHSNIHGIHPFQLNK